MYFPGVSFVLTSFASFAHTTRDQAFDESANIVDLGYQQFQGATLPADTVNQWLGIRYAAAPVGDLRFRAPQDPPGNSTLEIADTVCWGLIQDSPRTAINIFTAWAWLPRLPVK